MLADGISIPFLLKLYQHLLSPLAISAPYAEF